MPITCVLYNGITSINDQLVLDESFVRIFNWIKEWQMNSNFDETVFTRFTNTKWLLVLSYGIENVVLNEVSEFKYLGVFFYAQS